MKSYVRDLKAAKVLKGHILCYCYLTTELVRFFYRIPRIIGFLNYQKDKEELPNFVSPEVVKNFFAELAEKNELKTIISDSNLSVNDLVKVVEGAFINYEGRITHLDKKKKKVKIIVESSGWEINGIPASSCRKILENKDRKN